MGNELSSSDVEEDQEESSEDVKPLVGVEVQNGPVTLQSAAVMNTAPQSTQENPKATIQQENVITSNSQQTIVLSPVANGTDANLPTAPAKSKFRLTLSRTASGRTAIQPNGPETGEVTSEVSLKEPALVQTQNNAPIAVETSLTKENMGGGPNRAPHSENVTVDIENPPQKPREVSIFNRLFKPEKKVEFEEPVQSEVPENQEVVVNLNQNSGLQSAPPSASLQIQANTVGGPNQAPPTALPTNDVSISQPITVEVDNAPPKPKEISIFQRLFKPEKKMESEEPVHVEFPENQEVVINLNQNSGLQCAAPSANLQIQNGDKGSQAAVDGQSSEPASLPVGPETTTEATQTSPQPEIHPVMSFFKTLVNKPVPKSEEEEAKPDARDKPKKDEAQTSGDKVVLELPIVSVSAKSEQSAPEQVIPQDVKSSNVPPQIAASADEGKSGKDAPARPRLFWRKGIEESALTVSVNTAPEPALTPDTNPPDVSTQPQEEEQAVKQAPPRPLPFWRKSFRADPQPPKFQENMEAQQPVVSVSVEQSAPEQPAVPETKPTEVEIPSPDSEKPVKEANSRPVPFWKKSYKGDPEPQKVLESVVVEQPVVSVSLNAEKSAPEQIAAPAVQPPDAVIAPPENEKPMKEAASRPVPFWRKSFKVDPQPPKTPENSSPEEPVTIQLTETSSSDLDSQSAKPASGAKTSPVTEGKSQQGKKADEGKNAKPKIMMFFKQLSVMGDPTIGTSEEANGNISPTLDITDGVEVGKSEKTVVTAVVEPPPAPPLQKTKENPKEKKASSEKLTKQDSRESPEAASSSQAQAIESAPAQNGAESSKDGQMKRVEKRQSLGSFFKAIGPKRLCDAEVQTDPVSILPAEKAK